MRLFDDCYDGGESGKRLRKNDKVMNWLGGWVIVMALFLFLLFFFSFSHHLSLGSHVFFIFFIFCSFFFFFFFPSTLFCIGYLHVFTFFIVIYLLRVVLRFALRFA